MNSKLSEFLRTTAEQPWIWGRHDCGLWLADWYVFATGAADPAFHIRGTYASEDELAERAGPAYCAKLIRAIVRAVPLSRTRDPLPGDIGLVAIRTPEIRMHVGAIRAAHGWVVPGDIGVTRLPGDALKVLAAWRVEE